MVTPVLHRSAIVHVDPETDLTSLSAADSECVFFLVRLSRSSTLNCPAVSCFLVLSVFLYLLQETATERQQILLP